MVGYSHERKHVNGIGENWGSGGLCPGKILQVIPSRKSEKPFCKIRYKWLSSLIFILRRTNSTANMYHRILTT